MSIESRLNDELGESLEDHMDTTERPPGVEGLLDLMDASSSAWQMYGEGLGSHTEALEADARLEDAIRAALSEPREE